MYFHCGVGGVGGGGVVGAGGCGMLKPFWCPEETAGGEWPPPFPLPFSVP